MRKVITLSLVFQAEDGIRHHYVTGVQTCAHPIWKAGRRKESARRLLALVARAGWGAAEVDPSVPGAPPAERSEERRVGKECRSRWSPHAPRNRVLWQPAGLSRRACLAAHAQGHHVEFGFSSRRRHTTSLRDWSSDVCTSDLEGGPAEGVGTSAARPRRSCRLGRGRGGPLRPRCPAGREIGRAPCRERV